MCGIAGIFDRAGRPVTPEHVLRMREVMAHRGPDAAGCYTGPGIGLGHRRLAVIDLSPDAEQPMQDESQQVYITYNGEIYNFECLKEELAGEGYRFRTRSDTEVVLAAYRHWGDGFLTRLRGMFALALWDARHQRLLLARDRVGKKPLFYCEHGGRVYFASDIKAILAALDFTPSVDPAALDCYLTYLCVPHHHAIFEGIRKVPPAHVAVFTAAASHVEPYWQLDFRPKLQLTETEALAQLEERLAEAVRLRMISDVPLGAFLSGGVDSSLVVALMARQAGQVRTFSIGFAEETHNELPYARRVAEHCGTQHQEFVVETDAAAILPELVWHYGEPFADSSAVPSYYVASMARQSVTVVLNGDGGDESFCGYSRSRLMAAAALYRKLVPAAARARAAPGLADLIVRAVGRRGLASKLKTLTEYGRLSAAETYVNDSVLLPYRDKLYSPQFIAALAGHDPRHPYRDAFSGALADDDVDRGLAADFHSWLPDDLLVKVDVATMAHSLEARSPLLDQEVIAFAAALPSGLKLRRGVSKYLLKRLAERYVPPEVLYRPKMGFSVPLDRWLRTTLRPYLEGLLLAPASLGRGYFRPDAVRALVAEHLSGRQQHGHRLWALLWLELWHRMFVDRTLPWNTTLHDLLPQRNTN